MHPYQLSNAWKALKHAMVAQSPVDGVVTEVVPKGLVVKVQGISTFMPQSQLNPPSPCALVSYIGTKLRCNVLRLQPERCSAVVVPSIDAKTAAMERLHVGDIVHGTIKCVESYGAFVALDGVDGLIASKEMVWSKCCNPAATVQTGQSVLVKVLSLDTERKTVELSLRQVSPHPWEKAKHWPVGTRIEGVVHTILDYGCFVRLCDGVDGLLHASTMTPTKFQTLVKGATVAVVVLSTDLDKKRIAIGLAPEAP